MSIVVGGIKYKTVERYQALLIKVWFVFVACGIALWILKDNMAKLLYDVTMFLVILMLIHLVLKYADSKKRIKYPFNDY